MKFLFIGLGSIGQRHLRNIKKLYPNSEILAYRTLNRKISLSNNQKLLKADINKKYKVKLLKITIRHLKKDQMPYLFVILPPNM